MKPVISVAIVSVVCTALALGGLPGSESGYLRVLQRQIHPSALIYVELTADGRLRTVEMDPASEQARAISETTIDDATGVLVELDEAGFFSWPSDSLVPPPGLDVDSDPLRVALRWGDDVRVLHTRQPHVPDVLQSVLDRLRSLLVAAPTADSCVVCIAEPVHDLVPPLETIDLESQVPLAERLREVVRGPFPLVLSSRDRKATGIRDGTQFGFRHENESYRFRCHTWLESKGDPPQPED